MTMTLFSVVVKNRVVRRRSGRPIKGTQGRWYHDEYLVLALDKVHAEEATERDIVPKVRARRMLGIPRNTFRDLVRQVKIENIRRLE